MPHQDFGKQVARQFRHAADDVALYGRTPSELAESIRMAELTP